MSDSLKDFLSATRQQRQQLKNEALQYQAQTCSKLTVAKAKPRLNGTKAVKTDKSQGTSPYTSRPRVNAPESLLPKSLVIKYNKRYEERTFAHFRRVYQKSSVG